MADKIVSFNTHCYVQSLAETHLESVAKWLSCNGEVCGIGPTAVFASAAALFLYNELEATIYFAGNHSQVSLMEKTLISTMVLGMLSLMIHLWVCTMRFFQYYLDTLIRESPNILLELTTAGLLGSQTSDIVPLAPLTKFLRQQQPQIHITVCWFLSLCYADYVRKHYCQRFNMPYLEQWQTELHERATRSVHQAMAKVNRFVGSVHQRLRGYGQNNTPSENHTVRAVLQDARRRMSADLPAKPHWVVGADEQGTARAKRKSYPCSSSTSRARPLLMLSRSSERISWRQGVRVAVHKSPASVVLALSLLKERSDEDCPWKSMLLQWAKCGDDLISAVPTVLWAVGAAALAQRLIASLFRRFLFRRVPLWELVFQNLLFIWMVIYSLHFWSVLVRILKAVIEYCYREEDKSLLTNDDVNNCKMMQQWMIWMFGVAPLAVYIQTRPRPESTPLMIWITTSPWQRREMGPYGYYLNRPVSSLQLNIPTALRQQAFTLRKAFSDSKIILKEPPKKRRFSKSV